MRTIKTMRSHSLPTSFKLSGRPLNAKNSTRLSGRQSIFQYPNNQIRHFVGKMCKNAVCKQKVGMFSYQDKYVQVSELKRGRAQCNYIVLSSVMIKFVSPRSNSPPQLCMSQAWSLETTKNVQRRDSKIWHYFCIVLMFLTSAPLFLSHVHTSFQ